MTIKIRNLDGLTHLAYFDRESETSFTYSGLMGGDPSDADADEMVSVSVGGYGERPSDEFSMWDFDQQWGEGSLAYMMNKFGEACRAWIARKTDPKAIRDAFIRGYDTGLMDTGVTYDGDPESPRSQAYDRGRTQRRQMEGLE